MLFVGAVVYLKKHLVLFIGFNYIILNDSTDIAYTGYLKLVSKIDCENPK
jgi:hypothetical protein